MDEIADVGYTAANLKRPGIQEAFARLASGDADALVVSRIDRLSRSLLDFAGVMDLAQRKRWALIALDLGVDTSTPLRARWGPHAEEVSPPARSGLLTASDRAPGLPARVSGARVSWRLRPEFHLRP